MPFVVADLQVGSFPTLVRVEHRSTPSRHGAKSIVIPTVGPRCLRAGAEGSRLHCLGSAYSFFSVWISLLCRVPQARSVCLGLGVPPPCEPLCVSRLSVFGFHATPSVSSRPERPDFFLRAAFWRVGPRSGGIPLPPGAPGTECVPGSWVLLGSLGFLRERRSPHRRVCPTLVF